MKKTLVIISIMLALLATVVSAEYKYISDSDILTASLVNQDPDPAIAGTVVEIRVGIENWGADPTDEYLVELVPKYPLTALAGESYVKETGLLQGFQADDDQKILKFRVLVDKDTTEGSYPFDVLIYKKGERDIASTKKTLMLDVNAKQSAEVIYIDQVKLLPGQPTPLKFTIHNVGNAPLKDMSFSWNNKDDVVLPVGSGDAKFVKFLGVDEETTLTYNVIADTNSDAGLYKLDLILTYDDPITGESTVTTHSAGIYVGGETDFEVSFSEQSSGEYSFTIANTGTNAASSVSVSVPKQNGWSTSGSNSAILGNLNQGDYTVASFTLSKSYSGAAGDTKGNFTRQPRSTSPDEITNEQRAARRTQFEKSSTTSNTIDIDVAYTDTMGNRLTVTKQVDMPDNSTNMTARMPGKFNGNFNNGRRTTGSLGSALKEVGYYLLGIIAICLVIYGIIRYRRKKNRISLKK